MTLININRPKNKKVIKIEDIIGKDILQEIKFETKFQEAKIQEENEEADVLDILKSLHREKS
jgi:predicted transcriptional regulator